ncbi:hypothetical protein [Pinibacter aurantiacus]|uniref:Uncharacterized protein n=1 Tax=Pinibacter aurantiacus TaxID=2851599 RepID=A0A9E2SFC7_9BACT|nr:hypothetical protein [Pinibacter aurantiacus]MBV4360418.1 hypothetical protein [Pinibacter aurantiacus]
MTTIFSKEHLRKRHYDWSDGRNHSMQNNEPDRRTFDRFNGFQVLFIINYFGKSLGKQNIAVGLKVEELISAQLPPDVKSELSVFHWLRGVYLFYGN